MAAVPSVVRPRSLDDYDTIIICKPTQMWQTHTLRLAQTKRASSGNRYHSRAVSEGDAVPEQGANAMSMPSPLTELRDDHDNREADYCDEWCSLPGTS